MKSEDAVTVMEYNIDTIVEGIIVIARMMSLMSDSYCFRF